MLREVVILSCSNLFIYFAAVDFREGSLQLETFLMSDLEGLNWDQDLPENHRDNEPKIYCRCDEGDRAVFYLPYSLYHNVGGDSYVFSNDEIYGDRDPKIQALLGKFYMRVYTKHRKLSDEESDARLVKRVEQLGYSLADLP